MAGAKSKLTKQVRQAVREALELGMTLKGAAATAGIGESTIMAWRAKGVADIEAGEATPHAEFLEETERARYVPQQRALRVLREAQDGQLSVDAAKFMLSHRYRDEFGTKTTSDTTVNAAVSQTTTDTCAVLLAALTGQIAEPDGAAEHEDGHDDD
jgi:transposase-like protein